jgi:Transposase DDE domain
VWSKSKETTKRLASRNIRFIRAAFSIVKTIRITPYSCKYSKKIYTQYQLLVLILFKDYRNQHYREFIEDVGDMKSIQEELDLSVVPHFTTLQKFFCRIKTLYLRYAFRKTLNLFYCNDDPIPVTAIDSSGFTSGYSSHYYSARTGKIRKHFLKTSISVDTEIQVITGFIASKSRVHDTRHAHRLLRQCHKIRQSECYVMDRGYDSEALHRQIREDLHADSIIPIRSWKNEVVGGAYRKEMATMFDEARYRRRQLVENKFSVLKRKFGGDLKARKFIVQMKEIANKMIVCNIHRFLQFLFIEVFYRARKIKHPPPQFFQIFFCAKFFSNVFKIISGKIFQRPVHFFGSSATSVPFTHHFRM